ncbi:photosystem reaction center subunit H [Curtobacterium sp. MCSS17_011]|uniref:DUF2382 domain-containing protein n=1 Tax=Curtobacterium sp. MCSS17_011 TaxID=2175643 RepID=UPI000D9D28FC|nr:PRC and DUF2382 domain-containing protein [Curtobacterium sp. MCSS17_011]PYY61404.1 photosystem reaction center subunit H [Curtobacterium sp. MCSS17_011]
MIDSTNLNSVFGAQVTDPDGAKVGTVKQVYVDQQDGHPLFASVSTGLFGRSESFVPLEGADLSGDELRVAYGKDQIKDAPRVEGDGELSDEEQDRVFDHYGIGGGHRTGQQAGYQTGQQAGYQTGQQAGQQARRETGQQADQQTGRTSDATDATTGTDPDLTAGAAGRDTSGSTGQGSSASTGQGTTRSAGHDTSGPDTDDAMTRSEERLEVGTEQVPAGRVRLRKHVVTEQQNVTVPVQHEELRVETEPITDANAGAALDGPALSDEQHEVTLNEERVVVDKETVPVERVRVGKETVTEQQQVSEDVSHEEIDLDQDGTTRR